MKLMDCSHMGRGGPLHAGRRMGNTRSGQGSGPVGATRAKTEMGMSSQLQDPHSTPPPHVSEGLLCSQEPRPRASLEEMGLRPGSRLSGDS